jgi:transposase
MRVVFEHQHEYKTQGAKTQGAAIRSIASKMEKTRETLRNEVNQAERDHGQRAGATKDPVGSLV